MTSDNAITVAGLAKAYHGRAAVRDVDFEVGRGEVFALLGPNGAGKTTVIEILAGHRRRDTGTVAVLGSDPADRHPGWRARIGIVPQRTDDLSNSTVLSVRDWVRATAAYFPDPYDVDEVIELVGLADRRDTRPAMLSGGQRRRLDVALGIVGRPELLFLDEPTTGFDPHARRQFWTLISGLAASGTTVLLTTHYLDEVEHLADRVAVLSAGRIVEVATPATVGGRATAEATVRWVAAEGLRSVTTRTPAAVVADLVTRYGGEVPGLVIERPSLEDTYLRLTGRPA
jgi:ABC-2 type transport system ATP-binding protein